MQNIAVERNVYRTGSFYDTADIFFVYFAAAPIFCGNGDKAFGNKAFYLRTADSRYARMDFAAGHHFGAFNSGFNGLHCGFDIHDNARAQPRGRRGSDARYQKRTVFRVFADDRAYAACSYIKSRYNIAHKFLRVRKSGMQFIRYGTVTQVDFGYIRP